MERFLDWIDGLAIEQWLRIGSKATAHVEQDDHDRLARARLDRIVSNEQLLLARWFVYDSVDAAAQRILLAGPVRERRTCALLYAARDALYCAAMALALCDRLDRSDYDALSAACARTSIAT